ncbi:hypothetical protein GGR53DRAFT_466366 [Hypoxylon sp. FL1150]|nr:hypothetical protein GGR53DRAFT_466366 [Hypoxylon sp. FL1150]
MVLAVGKYQNSMLPTIIKPESRAVVSEHEGLFRLKKVTEDDIAIGKELVHPQTMTISLLATRIPDDQEAILGSTIDSTDQRLREAAAEANSNDSDEDIALYA